MYNVKIVHSFNISYKTASVSRSHFYIFDMILSNNILYYYIWIINIGSFWIGYLRSILIVVYLYLFDFKYSFLYADYFHIWNWMKPVFQIKLSSYKSLEPNQ